MFTTVEAVRLRTGLDAQAASDELVTTALADAHALVLGRLSDAVVVDPLPDALALGEGLLAGACVLRALSLRAAAERRNVKVGGQSVERGRQSADLLELAARLEADAWETLAPFLNPQGAATVLEVNESQDVL